jgi:hypothetical protein
MEIPDYRRYPSPHHEHSEGEGVDPAYLSLMLFAAGVLIQIGLMLGRQIPKDYLLIFGCLAASMVAFLPGKNESEYNLYAHCVLYIFCFILSCSGIFSRKILPKINERSLLLFNVQFLYFGIVKLYPVIGHHPIAFIPLFIAGICSLSVLINAIIPVKPPRWAKIYFYAWYLVMSVGMLFLIFPAGILLDILSMDRIVKLGWLQCVTSGMIAVYLGLNTLNVFLLIPIPGKGQSFENRIKDLREHIAMLNSKYEDEQLKPIESILLLCASLGFLLLNHFVIKFENLTIINISLLIVCFVVGGVFHRGTMLTHNNLQPQQSRRRALKI